MPNRLVHRVGDFLHSRFVPVRGFVSKWKQPLAGILVASLLTIFVWSQWGELPSLWRTIKQTSPVWLAVAIALEAGLVCMTTLGYRLILARLGYRCRFVALLGVYLQGALASALVPIGEPAAATGVVLGLGNQGVPRDDALLAWSLSDSIGFSGSVGLLLPTMALLAARHRLSTPVLIGAALMFVLTLLIAGCLTIVLRGGRLAQPLERIMPVSVDEFLLRVRRHQVRPVDLLPVFGLSLLGEVGSVTVLALVLHAVGYRLHDLSIPLFAYEVGYASWMLSPIYSGVGAVELSMTATLRRLHVPAAAALAATLLFRAMNIWLPPVFGLGWQVGRRLNGHVRPAGSIPSLSGADDGR